MAPAFVIGSSSPKKPCFPLNDGGGVKPASKKVGATFGLFCRPSENRPKDARQGGWVGGGVNAPLPPPGKLSVLEELTGGGRVICLFLFSKNRQMTRELPMDHGSSVYGSGVPKPNEDSEED